MFSEIAPVPKQQPPAGNTLASPTAVGAVGTDPLGLEAALQQLIAWLKLFFWALVALFVLALLWMVFSHQ
jgi:hypothetical protein